MADKFISERNLKFLLYEVFNTPALTQYPYYADHSRESFDMALDTAMKIGRNLMKPKLSEMDKMPPEFVNGSVKVHPVVRTLMKECGEGGWIGANFAFDLGGQQLPLMVSGACRFILCAANYSASVYPFLTTGAAHLILSFGSQELIDAYIPKMFSGEWQGTMALTEPQAGSSLADITTAAESADARYYRIRGQKIFISAGDHDGVDNVVHLMLAKIKGAPAGVKGISLFIVPQKRMEEGRLVSNDVSTAGIYHKLGYRGAPITQLSMGENNDCRGYLVGEPHKGLLYMLQMMNEARIDIGLGAAAIASAAYYASLEYAKERPQGRKLASKDPTQPQIPIVEHADIKRMLLFQRAVIEGSMSLIFQCSWYADNAKVLSGGEKEKNELLLDLLTPVAKSYPSEMGIPSVSAGLQILGGYGYCDEFPLEQFYRDARIHPIHEGTTGVQGITLLGRNVTMKNGQAFKLFLGEVQSTMSRAEEFPELKPYASELKEAVDKLTKVTLHLIGVAQAKGPDLFLADSTLYLEFFGIVSVAWQWLLQALSIKKGLSKDPSGSDADFYRGKDHAFRYFFRYELPKIEGLARRLMDADGLTVEMKAEYFSD
ncbi:MAG TPA: acyl-CoA dehydrogenase [Thermodesulfobacteriota bacterium]|nr:acyl-CoA dehydrogenase [Thermodesulfobacteriota bacterium]